MLVNRSQQHKYQQLHQKLRLNTLFFLNVHKEKKKKKKRQMFVPEVLELPFGQFHCI